LDARKALGQHFLLDLNVTRRIVRAVGDLSGTHVLEVGPGPGGLTRAILDAEPASVLAVERDARCVAALADLVEAAEGRLGVLEADAMAVEGADLLSAPRVVIANLPYNVGTQLLLGWLRRLAEWRSLTLMFQEEVAERIVAAPGSKTYGRLSVIAGWRAEARILFRLPARAFTPPPKVASAVVHLVPRAAPAPARWETMETVTAAAFGQRRKMLRQSLRPLGDAEALLAAAGLPGTARAEEIGVDGFAALARAVDALKPAG
jgi:16S rRNA (adenine1518-N6/adenine1519-N6)-dimethyltransferase